MVIYTDYQFKKGFKTKSIDDIQKNLESIVNLAGSLFGRDTFIASYTNLLGIRLLEKTSLSTEAEETMVQLLKV